VFLALSGTPYHRYGSQTLTRPQLLRYFVLGTRSRAYMVPEPKIITFWLKTVSLAKYGHISSQNRHFKPKSLISRLASTFRDCRDRRKQLYLPADPKNDPESSKNSQKQCFYVILARFWPFGSRALIWTSDLWSQIYSISVHLGHGSLR
jgi:hypothetical protein